MALIFVFGDQLSLELSSLRDADKSRDVIVMREVMSEATSVKHHKQKLVFIFSAMRHFARTLKELGYTVDYKGLDDADNTGSFTSELEGFLSDAIFDKIILTRPSEYRVVEIVRSWEEKFGVPVDIRPDDRFLASCDDFAKWADGRKALRMEFFYREMRKRYGILMDGADPVGGKWNYDSENRKPPKGGLDTPTPFMPSLDTITLDVITMVKNRFDDHFGEVSTFPYAVTRDAALTCFNDFIENRLPTFGDYQDAMLIDEPWMYHSLISAYVNIGLLLPMECIEAAEQAYRSGKAPLNAAEGFIRQILGWREYVRGLYWLKMPNYEQLNALGASRDLPSFYWGAPTQMSCLSQCVKQTREYAYAHHIQRLMVLGNFALLAGLNPDEVNEWFHIVYADAFHWVELPNVTGMALFADGGIMASKPYASSGAYINKMSNYCGSCSYKVTQKNGPKACPFNYLYWDFLDRNAEPLSKNHRLGMAYRTLSKLSDERKEAIRTDAARFLKRMEHGETV